MRFEHEFVDYIPETLLQNRIYISIRFGTLVHLCACGCGEEVVTPLGPAEWAMEYDGRSVSLKPSVGNWGFACRSHYWISKNRVHWAPNYSDVEVERIRRANSARRGRYFDPNVGPPATGVPKRAPLFVRVYRRTVGVLLSRLGGNDVP